MQAYQGALNSLNQDIQGAEQGDQESLAKALHLIQDSYSSAHSYKLWNGNQLTHLLQGGDLLYHTDATVASFALLEALEGNLTVGQPAYYLAPPPTGCN